jgi:2-polyprenyl-3-methyl-5-hydroxy-6-metoxy-1,4-benzoquinol methylase
MPYIVMGRGPRDVKGYSRRRRTRQTTRRLAIVDRYGQHARYSARPELLDFLDSWGVNPRRVLDVGCGSGLIGERLLARGAAEVWGIEPSSEAAQTARTRLSHVLESTFPCATVEGETFDLVVMADVLEHLTDPWAALSHVRELLNADGHLFLSMPNVSHLSVVLALLRGTWDYTDEGLLDRTHMRFFTPRTTRTLVEGAGLVVTRSDSLRLRTGTRGYLAIESVLARLVPHLAVYQCVMLARRA